MSDKVDAAKNDAALDTLIDAEVEALRVEYRKTIPEKIRELEAAEKENRLADLSTLAHKARGSAGSYGFADLSKLFAAIEDATIALKSGDESQRKKITDAIMRLKSL